MRTPPPASASETSLPQTIAGATGIVLAGGRSTRFGSDKLTTEYRGVPLLHHAVARLAGLCEEVVVVLSPDGPEPTMPAGVRVRFARDTADAEGPLVGLRAGLMASRTELVLVAGGDMPDLKPPVLREMLRAAHAQAASAVVLVEDDRVRPLPCVLRTLEAQNVSHALLGTGVRRLRSLVEGMRPTVIDEATWTALDPDRGTLFDVDEPGDIDF